MVIQIEKRTLSNISHITISLKAFIHQMRYDMKFGLFLEMGYYFNPSYWSPLIRYGEITIGMKICGILVKFLAIPPSSD